jgi:hypothetical protein
MVSATQVGPQQINNDFRIECCVIIHELSNENVAEELILIHAFHTIMLQTKYNQIQTYVTE